MITVSRAEWNARPPLYTNPLDLSQVSLFIVHYSGASRDQTVRSIQDYCMDVKGYSDIDYNAIVKDGKHYVGRGWNKGGHTLNHNSISYGVCVVGMDGDATPEDMNCVREIYEMVCAKLGRRITITDHRRVLGASSTDCPGDELDGWVAAGMPAMNTTGDDDMSAERTSYNADRYAWKGVMQLADVVDGIRVDDGDPNKVVSVQNGLAKAIKGIDSKLDKVLSLPPGGLTEDQIRAIVRDEFRREIDAVRYAPTRAV